MPQIKLNAKQIVTVRGERSSIEHVWFLDTETKVMYLRQVIRDEFGPAGAWNLENLTRDSLWIDRGQEWLIVSGVRNAVVEAYLFLETASGKKHTPQHISTQTAIIKALHSNVCPLCLYSQMCADVVHNYGRRHKVAYFVECLHCCNRWEITKETFEEEVKIAETKSYKLDQEVRNGTSED